MSKTFETLTFIVKRGLVLICVLSAAILGPVRKVLAMPPVAKESRAILAPGDYHFLINSGGRDRTYLVHVPPQSTAGEPLSLVLNFHGGGGSAANQRDYSKMDPVADRYGFIVAYPNGTGILSEHLLTWNAGTCCGYAMKHQIDDVAFTLALIDDLAARTPVELSRVYATGLSNGAMMAYRLAAEAGDRIAAIAPVAGVMVVETFHPARSMPIMHIHSADDPRALYYGGLGPPFPMTNTRVQHPAVESMLTRWRTFDGCPDKAKASATVAGAPGSVNEGITATKYVWGPCADGSDVVLWKLTGSGHVWPGGHLDFYPCLLGRGTDIIDANEKMWRFFRRFSLPAK